MKLVTIEDIERYLHEQIGRPGEFRGGDWGFARMKEYVRRLGNPQEKMRVVHVAATSGKGSICTLIARLLVETGVKTGLHVSPHLTDIRERAQVNGKMIEEEKFVGYFNDALPVIESMRESAWGALSYYEILMGVTYDIFAGEKVDYAVIETGMGGLLDGSNVVRRADKVAVLGRIGLDHTHILGKSYQAIARQKAGIVHEGNLVVALTQRKDVMEVFRGRARAVGAGEFWEMNTEEAVSSVMVLRQATKFDFAWEGMQYQALEVGLLGGYQAENAAIALAAFQKLVQRDGLRMNERVIRKALREVSFGGRMTVGRFDGKLIVADGAHNGQKMRAFVKSLRTIFPARDYVFVIAFKKGKDISVMLEIIGRYARAVVVTKFFTQDEGLVSMAEDTGIVAELAQKVGIRSVITEDDVREALGRAVELAGEEPVVVTGSLYLMSEVCPVIIERGARRD